jgi:glutamyl/glutaminyl-tRNA synthetase
VADESVYSPNPKYAPYRQSERLEIYSKYIQILLEKKLAYIAYDTSNEILIQKEEQKKSGIYSFRYDPE